MEWGVQWTARRSICGQLNEQEKVGDEIDNTSGQAKSFYIVMSTLGLTISETQSY